MTDRYDVAVLGTGLFGAALAYHLARDGESRVLALGVEASPRQRSGTDSSAGILTLQGWDPWDLALVRESAREYDELARTEGGAPVRRNGGLRIARTPEGERWLDRVHRLLARQSIEARSVAAGEVRDLLPFASFDGVRAALYTPDDSTVSAPDLRRIYLRRAARAGAVILSSSEPYAVEPDGPSTWKLHTEPVASAHALVVAAGAWSKTTLARLGQGVPLAPFRAQALRARPRPLLASFPTLHDLDLNLYARPDARGRLLAGDGTGTREEDPLDWNPAADPDFVASTGQALTDLLDGLEAIRTESTWAGLCVASPDRFPLVGRLSGSPPRFVASGFNGFGTMRAAALARRLAQAIRSDRWDALRPADPRRFRDPPAPFDPRPEFPLEADEESSAAAEDVPMPTERPTSDAPAPPSGEIRYRRVTGLEDVDRLHWAPLSEWFDPFLGLFAKDSIRTGGRVEVAEEEGVVRGLSLFGSAEGVGSGFTRHRSVAERYLDRMDTLGVYLEEPWRPGGEPVEVFAADPRDWRTTERPRNPVRIARREDLDGIRELMRWELGPSVDAWFATLPRPEETAFLSEVRGQVVGVSWLSRVGPFARGHSFVVHPRFRGLGIGSDLLHARMRWLHTTGGQLVVSEIYDGNIASRTAAERAGMALVARMYHFRPTARRG